MARYSLFVLKLPLNPKQTNIESGAQVTCDVGYLCANFGLSRPLCFRLRPMYVTDVRRHTASLLYAPSIRGRGIITIILIINNYLISI